MREYLFRGKRLDNGEWVYGGYCKHDTVKVCFTTDDPKTKHMIIKDGFCDWGFEPPLQGYEVDPETVGQYTGLTDKNGVKIFEGDIIRHKTYLEERIYRILYDEGAFCYFYDRNTYPLTDYEFGLYCENVEVIGNIHDNPELLQEGGE